MHVCTFTAKKLLDMTKLEQLHKLADLRKKRLKIIDKQNSSKTPTTYKQALELQRCNIDIFGLFEAIRPKLTYTQ